MPTIAESVLAQNDRALDMLKQVVEACDDAMWVVNEHPFEPARQAYHALDATEGYGRAMADDVPTTRPLPEGSNWYEEPAGHLPDRKETLLWIEDCRKQWRAWLSDKPDAWFLELKGDDWKWTGATWLEHALYNIRHLTLHTGVAAAIARKNGADVEPWA